MVDGGLKNFVSILVTTYWPKQEKMPLRVLAAAFKYHLRLYIKTAQYSKESLIKTQYKSFTLQSYSRYHCQVNIVITPSFCKWSLIEYIHY